MKKSFPKPSPDSFMWIHFQKMLCAPKWTVRIWFYNFRLFQPIWNPRLLKVSLSLRMMPERGPFPSCTSSAPELHVCRAPVHWPEQDWAGDYLGRVHQWGHPGCWFPLPFLALQFLHRKEFAQLWEIAGYNIYHKSGINRKQQKLNLKQIFFMKKGKY